MTTPSFLSATGLCVLLVLPPAGLIAAESKGIPDPPGYAPAKSEDPWQRRLKEVRYDGVPLSEIVRVLDEKFPEINFVLTPGEDDPSLMLNLRGVALDDIFTAMNLATRGRVQAAKVNDRMVSIKLVEAAMTEPAPKKVCRAFSLGYYLSGRSEDQTKAALKELEDALEQCWTMLQKANPADPALQKPELSLHPTTKLLIVVGVPEQLAVVEQVVKQLEGVNIQPTIDPATGLPITPGAGVSGGGGRRPPAVPDPAITDAFRRRYGLDLQPAQPAPPRAPSTNRF